MHYEKQKRAKVDKCNICKQTKELTWDHVPPKAVLVEKSTYAAPLFSALSSDSHQMTHYQSGIKYRTICAECNGALLGKYDAAYREFTQSVVQRLDALEDIIRTRGVIPRTITVELQINKVLRSICGHLLSMKKVFDDKTRTDEHLRKYVLNERLKLDNEHLFCWFYPYPTVLNLRDFATGGYQEQTHPKGLFSVTAAYPLAFLLSSEDESERLLDNLSQYSTEDIEERIEITLSLDSAYFPGSDSLKPFIWPMNISEETHGAMFAIGNHRLMEGSMFGIAKK